ncbi:MAG: 4Fe-4S dicluster domain-containing protein [Fidelibacterota bacterium]
MTRIKRHQKNRPKALIIEDECSGCEICMAVCPVNCIVKVNRRRFSELSGVCKVITDRCTGCKICFLDCPWDAVVMAYPESKTHDNGNFSKNKEVVIK